MCKEGIRVGRQAAVEYASVAAGNQTVPNLLLRPRPDRIGVTFSADPDGLSVAGALGVVITTDAAGKNVVASLSLYTPSLSLDIERHGQIVTGGFWAWQNSGITPVIYAAGIYLTSDLHGM